MDASQAGAVADEQPQVESVFGSGCGSVAAHSNKPLVKRLLP
jgi:hypothetical protein